MDHDRLRAWLGLPPGPWPPDHYALLDLARGAGAFDDVEARVLDRMELLRPHQLRHPELVTEGMNRLAQALVCLTDPVARAAYDRELGVPPPPFEVVEPEPLPLTDPDADPAGAAGTPADVPVEPVPRRRGGPQQPTYEVVSEPDPLPYEVLPAEEPAEAPDEAPAEARPRAAFEVVPDDSPGPARARDERHPPPAQISRRAVYRKLAALRRALAAWERLRPVYGTPSEPLATPVAVLLCVRALADARAALPGVPDVIRGPGAPGGAVAALVRSPHALHLVRTLLASQRRAVAIDWRRGYDALVSERARLRRQARAARARRGRRGGVAARLGRELARTPEWALAVLALFVLLFALLRRRP